MNIKVGSRLKCSLTGSEFMVVKIGDGALSNGGKNLIDAKENSEISSDDKKLIDSTDIINALEERAYWSRFGL